MKAEHRPHRIGDGRVRIGGSIYGVAAEIPELVIFPGVRMYHVLYDARGACTGARRIDDIESSPARTRPGASSRRREGGSPPPGPDQFSRSR
ncbi:hypothetical protein AB0B89_09010 [Sphaerisporangium sp. NPDC049002]|uniref:hypothetical protein n=1 Tax=Sphaerisporangium sp. NPDC049002 TaxID=3155392 RepID=UPI0033CD4B60